MRCSQTVAHRSDSAESRATGARTQCEAADPYSLNALRKSSCLNQESLLRENNFAPKTVSITREFLYIFPPCGVQKSASALRSASLQLRGHPAPRWPQPRLPIQPPVRKWNYRWPSHRYSRHALPVAQRASHRARSETP